MLLRWENLANEAGVKTKRPSSKIMNRDNRVRTFVTLLGRCAGWQSIETFEMVETFQSRTEKIYAVLAIVNPNGCC